ncbi:MAG: ROK family transcriptional regulator [Rubrobacter sp.]|nr:ROK family transcriptional regulator [Rubrobacter sp.]
MQGGTNLLKVRDFNQQVVLEIIRGASGVSRTEIAYETGLTAQTISNIVRRLLDEDLVVESGKEPSGGGGKPKVKLKINADAGYALGAQIDRDEIALVLLNLGGQPLRRIRRAVPASQTPEEVVHLVAESAEELVRHAGGIGHKTLGLGVASPGPLDPENGVLYEPPGFKNWGEVHIKQMLSERTGYPVLVDNDAMAAAVGERWVGKARGIDNFAFVYNGWGLGAGLFLEGHVYRGATGTAGEFGHTPLDPNGPPCACGNRGCLVRYCSPRDIICAVERRLRAGATSSLAPIQLENPHLLDLAAIHAAGLAGDWVAAEELAASGRMLGRAVVSMVNLLDLQLVVLGGKALGEAAHIYRREVEVALRKVLYPERREVRVELSGAGEDAGAVGAASVILHAAYAPRLMSLRSA